MRRYSFSSSSCRRAGTIGLPSCLISFAFTALAAANPTQDEIFKSINKNVGSSTDLSALIPWVLGAVGIIIMAVLFNHRRQRVGPRNKTLNHQGKLLREIARGIHLKNVEVKQLKMLSEERELSSPLTPLLCPSVLAKSLRTKNPKIDRRVIAQLVQRMNQQDRAEETSER